MKTLHIYNGDYYVKEQFDNPDLKYEDYEEEVRGVCPFCGGNITSVSKRIFRSKSSGQKIIVHVSALYGECSNCGAV